MTTATEQTTTNEQDTVAEKFSRYLDEVLLQPEQVNEVVLTAAEPVAQDAGQHPHGDY